MGLGFAAMLEALNAEVAAIKFELKQKNAEKVLINLPKVFIHEITAFGVVRVIFTNEMYVITRNETTAVNEKTRKL